MNLFTLEVTPPVWTPPTPYGLDVGMRLGARSRQLYSYGQFIKKVKCKYKYDNTSSMACLYKTKEPTVTYNSSETCQVRSYNYFVKKAKCRYKYDITLVHLARDPVE
jgi:hypothetical protein